MKLGKIGVTGVLALFGLIYASGGSIFSQYLPQERPIKALSEEVHPDEKGDMLDNAIYVGAGVLLFAILVGGASRGVDIEEERLKNPKPRSGWGR